MKAARLLSSTVRLGIHPLQRTNVLKVLLSIDALVDANGRVSSMKVVSGPGAVTSSGHGCAAPVEISAGNTRRQASVDAFDSHRPIPIAVDSLIEGLRTRFRSR